MQPLIGAKIEGASTIQQAVEGSDLVITATPSKQPLVKSEWVKQGAHITAMGSDEPEKQEPEASLLSSADKVVPDSLSQCIRLGEIHHAVEEGLMTPEDVYAELGESIIGRKPGRESSEEITICDLTSVGVQDLAIASLAYKNAIEKGFGSFLEI